MRLYDLLSGGKNRVEIIPPDVPCAKINAEYFQADESSNFGLLVTQSGGICAGGIVRLLGSNRNLKFRDINLFNIKFGSGGLVILGDDIFGGIFALNTGLFPECIGNVLYFAPDTLEFEDLEIKLSAMFEFLRNGDLRGFYGQISDKLFTECVAMNTEFNQVLNFYPPLWSKEFYKGNPSVRTIDVHEHYKLIFAQDNNLPSRQ